MLVAVTGSEGFLGSHLVEALRARGDAVRAVARAGGRAAPRDGVEFVSADLAVGCDPSVLAGAEALIHAAALYSERPEDEPRLHAVNVLGTGHVLEAAARAGLRRVVHVSTMGTCAPRADGRPATESDHVRPGPGTSAYVRTKLAGEELALGRTDFEVVVVNPAALVGSGDRKPSVTGRRILDVLRGRRPRLVRGEVNHVPVRACAEGILRALDCGGAGRRYLLGGENLGPRAFLERVARAASVDIPRASLRAWISEHLLRPRFSLAIDDRLARAELGYDPGDLDQAFREAIAWFQSAGMA